MTPMGAAWQDLNASSLDALQSSISYYIHPRFYTLAFQWLMSALDENHAPIVHDHGADTDDRPLRENPQILKSSNSRIR